MSHFNGGKEADSEVPFCSARLGCTCTSNPFHSKRRYPLISIDGPTPPVPFSLSLTKQVVSDLVNVNRFETAQLAEVATLVLDLLRDPRGSAFQVVHRGRDVKPLHDPRPFEEKGNSANVRTPFPTPSAHHDHRFPFFWRIDVGRSPRRGWVASPKPTVSTCLP